MTILVTGAAGFIGFHVSERLLARGEEVIGLDCVNDYYSVKLKRDRLAELARRHNGFRLVEVDFADNAALQKRAKEVDALRAGGKATLPTRMDLELETNPFLRPGVPAIQQRLGMVGKPDWQIFGEIRERKNRS